MCIASFVTLQFRHLAKSESLQVLVKYGTRWCQQCKALLPTFIDLTGKVQPETTSLACNLTQARLQAWHRCMWSAVLVSLLRPLAVRCGACAATSCK